MFFTLFHITILTSHKNITACHTCYTTANVILSLNTQQFATPFIYMYC